MESVRRRFPHTPSSASRARRELLAWLRLSGVPAGTSCDTAALVASELVANAVRHAPPMADGTVEVAWRRTGDSLTIEVTDAGGPDRPHVVDAAAHSLGGRGLLIVDSLALDWWVTGDASRRTVHAQVEMGWPSAL